MYANHKLSKSEQQYIIDSIKFNHRVDGRNLLDYRDIIIEPSVLRSTHGSCKIRLGDTELLCGASVELYEIDISKNVDSKVIDEMLSPKLSDLLSFKVDCSPNASPDFQGRGGEDIADSISNLLLKSWSKSQTIYNFLEIHKNKFYWRIYIDILVLECGGTLLDASSLAVHVTLKTTIFPRIQITEGDSFEPEVSLIDDPLGGYMLPNLIQGPLLITIHKIGNKHVIDPSLEEECCSCSSITVALSSKFPDSYLIIKKSGNKSICPESIKEMLEAAKTCFGVLHSQIEKIYKTKRIKDTNITSCTWSLGYMVE